MAECNLVDSNSANCFKSGRLPQTPEIKSRTSRVQRWWSLSFFISINHTTLKSQEFLEWQQHCQAVSTSYLMRHSPSPVLPPESLHPWESCNLCLFLHVYGMQIIPPCLPPRAEISTKESIGETVKGMLGMENAQVSHVVLLQLPATIGHVSLFWKAPIYFICICPLQM